MNDETALIRPRPLADLADVAHIADEHARATRLTRYQEGLRPETERRQKTDLALFTRFLQQVGTQPGDFYHDLDAWHGMSAGLIEAFIAWQKLQGYAIGSINVRLATVKAYCHLAYDTGVLDTDTHTHIQGVKGIQRRQARNIDAKRAITRIGAKKAEPVEIPLDLVHALKHPATGFLAARDALLMCLLLDHGLRVGEVAILKKTQINLKYVNPKTRKRRGLLTYDRPKVDKPQKDELTEDTYKAAKAYLPTIPADQESLFDLAIIGIQERVRTLGELVGLPGLSPHDCRHSWASRAACNGTPLDRLKQAGGWSNLQTPLRYIKDCEIANEGVKLG